MPPFRGRVELKIYHVYLTASSYLLMGISLCLLILRGGGMQFSSCRKNFSLISHATDLLGDLGQKFWMRCTHLLVVIYPHNSNLRVVVWGEAYLRDEVRIRMTGFKLPRPQDDVTPYLGGYVLIRA